LWHDVYRLAGHGFAPAVGGDFAAISIQSDDDFSRRDGASKRAKKAKIELALREGGAANDDLRRADFCERPRSGESANTATDADGHFVFAAGTFAKSCDQRSVITLVNCGV
jgi:hypothetical protein